MAINTLIQMPYQWIYNPIIEINTIGNVIKMLKYLPKSQSASVTIISWLSSLLNGWADF